MEPGSTLAGRYRVGKMIGRGGMGIVVEATHLQLGTPVAIKVLRADAADDPELVERFMREARSAARLRGEHVCRVQDFGTTDDGAPFMVMEYLEGEDLMSIVDRSGPLDPTLVATYILQACIGVAEAHALGIIHRDLKPGNLFVVKQPDGRRSVKLLDFGIAKSQRAVDVSLTNTSRAMGSPAYMAPEQLKASMTIDARCDVWSLGVTMFELLTERRPFDGDTPYELAIAIATLPPAPLGDHTPPELAKIVMRCLEKDRDKRYADVAELAAALAPLVKHGRDQAAQVRAALSPGDVVERPRKFDRASPMTETTLRNASGTLEAIPVKRSRFAIPLAIGALVLAAAGGVVWWTQREPAPVVAPAASPPPIAIDAAVHAIEIDAAIAPDAAEPDAAVAATVEVDAGVVEKKPPKKKKPKRGGKPQDFGSSRF